MLRDKTVKVRVCDSCGLEENKPAQLYVFECDVCGKDLCTKCGITISVEGDHFAVTKHTCKRHVRKEFLPNPDLTQPD